MILIGQFFRFDNMVSGSSSSSEGTRSPVKIFGNIFISFIGAGVLGKLFETIHEKRTLIIVAKFEPNVTTRWLHLGIRT